MQVEIRSREDGAGLTNTTISSHSVKSPAQLGKAAANEHQAVRGNSITWEHAGRGALLITPQTVAHFCVHKLGCFVHVQHRLCNSCKAIRDSYLQPGLFVMFPSPLLSWQMDLLWCVCPQRPLHKVQTTHCHKLLLVSITFPSPLVCPSPLCSTVMPYELAKCFSIDFKVLFKLLGLTASLWSLMIAVSLMPL